MNTTVSNGTRLRFFLGGVIATTAVLLNQFVKVHLKSASQKRAWAQVQLVSH
jgi:hypothetical protein